MITGQAQNTESVFTRNLVPPNQVTDAQEKFKKTIAEVLPYLDSAQSSAIINFIRGKGRDGTEDVSQIKEAATNPSTQMAGDTLMSAPGYRT